MPRRSSSGRCERGELRADIADLGLEALVGVIVGPIVFQKIVRRRKLTPEYVDACLDVVTAGQTSPRIWGRSCHGDLGKS